MGDGTGATCTNILLCILAVILPPLAVLVKLGGIGFYQERPAYLCVVVVFVALLTLLLWIPGVVAACYLICRIDDDFEG